MIGNPIKNGGITQGTALDTGGPNRPGLHEASQKGSCCKGFDKRLWADLVWSSGKEVLNRQL